MPRPVAAGERLLVLDRRRRDLPVAARSEQLEERRLDRPQLAHLLGEDVTGAGSAVGWLVIVVCRRRAQRERPATPDSVATRRSGRRARAAARRSARSRGRSASTLPISDVPSARERGDEHRHPGADVGALEPLAVKPARTADDRPVGIAERDPSAHRDELVDEEQAVLEHLLEDQDRPVGLGRERQGDRGEVGGERRPGAVVDLRDRVAEVVADGELLVRRDEQVAALDHASAGRAGGTGAGSSAGRRARRRGSAARRRWRPRAP